MLTQELTALSIVAILAIGLLKIIGKMLGGNGKLVEAKFDQISKDISHIHDMVEKIAKYQDSEQKSGSYLFAEISRKLDAVSQNQQDLIRYVKGQNTVKNTAISVMGDDEKK